MSERKGKWMIQEIISGEVHEMSKYWAPEQTKKRSKKKTVTTPRKRDENDRAATRVLARLINCNFSHGDLWLSAGYSEAGFKALCAKYEITDLTDIDKIKAASDHELELFLRRMDREAKKSGTEFYCIALSSDLNGKTGEIVRPHHHIIMPRASYELCMKHWKYGDIDYQILRNQPDYTPLAVYLCRQVRRQQFQHRWKTKGKLKKPVFLPERETHKRDELKVPTGAVALDIGHYDRESGNHYIRYIPKHKSERTKERKTRRSVNERAGGDAGVV